MKKLALICILTALGASTEALAANPGEGRYVADAVYRAINPSGMTGLLDMGSAYTVRKGELSFNTGIIAESVSGTSYTIIPLSVTYGLSNSKEVGVATKYISSGAGTGTGDTEINIKWRFRKQTEYLPAASLSVGFIAPTGSGGLGEVSSWGVKIHMLASSEAAITETGYIGLYIDIGLIALDPGQAGGDNYSEISLGALFPVSDNNRLQALMELNYVRQRNNPYLGTTNYTAITPGFRYASKSFKLTAGIQMRTGSTGINSTRFISNIGVEF